MTPRVLLTAMHVEAILQTMPHGPTHATIAVTARCNSRCAMCDIWKRKAPPEAEPSLYFRLPESLQNINLTGGEPYLRQDLPQIVLAVRERLPKARVVISTNGLAFDDITAATAEILRIQPHVGIRISLDGRPDTHDALRGVKSAHYNALRTLAALKHEGVADLGLAYTMCRGNESELLYVYELAREHGIEFTLSMVHS